MLFAFPLMPLFMISYDTLLLFPVPFLWFIICSKQVVKAVMSENVKLQVWYHPSVCSLLPCWSPVPAAEQAAGCAGHCHPCAPEMQHLRAPCDSESLPPWAQLRVPHSQSSATLQELPAQLETQKCLQFEVKHIFRLLLIQFLSQLLYQ